MKPTHSGVVSVWKLTPIIAFAIPIIILYHLYPSSFEMTWKGRTYQLFFIWLLTLETIIGWEALESNGWRVKYLKTLAFLMFSTLPTIYVVMSNYAGLNDSILNFALKHRVYFAGMMPLAMEYLVFAILLTLIVLVNYGVKTLSEYSISIFFAGIIGLIYLVDNLYPYGRFIPFQAIVPTTTQLAANILNAMNFRTEISNKVHPIYGSITELTVKDAQGRYLAGFGVAWPCAGVDSLLLYSVTMLLFFKKSAFSLRASVTYFAVGAAITYLINVLRIVSIFLVTINGGDWLRFHDYYGPLYSVAWITVYPLIIMGTQLLWRKIKKF
ncbi:MAG: exosortase/archaeosortase family protein [Candidatus Bathyarchaeia archaeon]